MKKYLNGLTGILTAALLLGGCSSPSSTEVTTAIAKTTGDVSSLSWHGNIEAEKTVDVLPGGTGKIMEIAVSEGSSVLAGDALFSLDSTDAALSLKQAQAGLRAAQAANKNAQAASSENTSVRPAQIAYNDAQANYERMQLLFNAGDISQVDLEAARSKVESAASSLQAAKNGQDSGLETTSAQLESAEAALEIAQKRLTDCTVTAPVSGVVTKLNIVTGQTVSPQAAAVTIMDASRENIPIQVADMDIAQIHLDESMNIYLQAPGQTIEGKVTEISPVCDPETGMFEVKVTLNEPQQNFTGLSADVTIPEDQVSSLLYVPAKGITKEDDQWFVYVVKDGTAVKTAVSVGLKKNAYMEILDGVSAGDEIVMQSSRELTDGMGVRVIAAK